MARRRGVLGHQVDKLARERAVHVRADPRLGGALVPLREVLVLLVHPLEPRAHLLRAVVRLLHQLLEPRAALLRLLARDGNEALAVVLLDELDVVPDRRHHLLHLVHLVEERRHERRLRAAAAAARLEVAGAAIAGAAHPLEVGQPVVHLEVRVRNCARTGGGARTVQREPRPQQKAVAADFLRDLAERSSRRSAAARTPGTVSYTHLTLPTKRIV